LDCKKGKVLFICSPANPVSFAKKAMLQNGTEKRLNGSLAAFFVGAAKQTSLPHCSCQGRCICGNGYFAYICVLPFKLTNT
jgi:hypothetical protein